MFFEMKNRSTVRLLLAAAGAMMLLAGVSAGQDRVRGSLTWPDMNVSVRVLDGWVVAEGRASGERNGLAWQTPLAPRNGGVSVQYGLGTSFVRVGERRFVVDDATGQAVELQPGEVWRQWQPDRPGEPEYPSPGLQPRQRVVVEPLPPEPALPAWSEDLPPSLHELADANEQLLQALAQLEETYEAFQAGTASVQQVNDAREIVMMARRQAVEAQNRAVVSVTPRLAGTINRGETPTEAVREAEQEVLGLNIAYTLSARRLEQLRALEEPMPEDVVAMAQEQRRVDELSRQLDAADRTLQQLRLTETLPPAAYVSPELQRQIEQQMQRLNYLTEEYDIIQRQLAARTGEVAPAADPSVDTEADRQRMLALTAELTGARSRLAMLRDQAYQQARQAQEVEEGQLGVR